MAAVQPDSNSTKGKDVEQSNSGHNESGDLKSHENKQTATDYMKEQVQKSKEEFKEDVKKQQEFIKNAYTNAREECTSDAVKRFFLVDDPKECCNFPMMGLIISKTFIQLVADVARLPFAERGGDWPIGLFGCCKDPSLFGLSVASGCCCTMAHSYGDVFDGQPAHALIPVCGLAWIPPPGSTLIFASMRARMRRKYGIRGSMCQDALEMFACTPCAVIQMAYVSKHYGTNVNIPGSGFQIDAAPWADNAVEQPKKKDNANKMQTTFEAPSSQEMKAGQ